MKLVLCLMVFILFFKSYDANSTTTSTPSKKCRAKVLKGSEYLYMRIPEKSVCLRGKIKKIKPPIRYYIRRINYTAMNMSDFNRYVNLFYHHPYYLAGFRSRYLFCEYYCVSHRVNGTIQYRAECNHGQMWSLSFFHCYVCRNKIDAYRCNTRGFLNFSGG